MEVDVSNNVTCANEEMVIEDAIVESATEGDIDNSAIIATEYDKDNSATTTDTNILSHSLKGCWQSHNHQRGGNCRRNYSRN